LGRSRGSPSGRIERVEFARAHGLGRRGRNGTSQFGRVCGFWGPGRRQHAAKGTRTWRALDRERGHLAGGGRAEQGSRPGVDQRSKFANRHPALRAHCSGSPPDESAEESSPRLRLAKTRASLPSPWRLVARREVASIARAARTTSPMPEHGGDCCATRYSSFLGGPLRASSDAPRSRLPEGMPYSTPHTASPRRGRPSSTGRSRSPSGMV
jgi:hypothetical protein